MCAKLVELDQGFCAEHKALQAKNNYKGRFKDIKFNKDSKRFYASKQWQALRKRILMVNPYCAKCNALATEVDHIEPICDGGSKLSRKNLQPLCKSCHSKKTIRETKAKVYSFSN